MGQNDREAAKMMDVMPGHLIEGTGLRPAPGEIWLADNVAVGPSTDRRPVFVVGPISRGWAVKPISSSDLNNAVVGIPIGPNFYPNEFPATNLKPNSYVLRRVVEVAEKDMKRRIGVMTGEMLRDVTTNKPTPAKRVAMAWVLGNCRFAQQAIPAPLTRDTYDATDNYWKPEFKVKGRLPETTPAPEVPVEFGQDDDYTGIGHGSNPATLWIMEPSGNILTLRFDAGYGKVHELLFKGKTPWIWQGRFDHVSKELSIAPGPGRWNEPLSSSLVDKLRKMFQPTSISRYASLSR